MTHGAEVLNVFMRCRKELERFARAAFPRLAHDVDDLLQEIWLELQAKVASADFQAPKNCESWLRMLVRSRAIDRLRSMERRILYSLTNKKDLDSETPERNEPIDTGPSPATYAIEQERRRRQGLLLSDVLVEFCRWCEKRPQRLGIKEAYERSLHGQSPAQIAEAMGVSPESVHQWLHQAREWVRQRVTERDVERSVFLTLYGGQ
ncbi:sigma-70 family RNA polymerase sigma factor [Thermogutta sp.]|uniref:RNA polymerase sigma factor n=1 Tax=Thermogutta sp. TaxID=1962930 RepID=UPI00321FAA5D